MIDRIHINPKLYDWAQRRSRISVDELTGKFPSFPEWSRGEADPTMKQLERFAAATYAPLGYLFLPEPPVESLPIPDFRTLKDQSVRQPSPHLLDTLYAVQTRQEWMRSYLIEQGEPALPFIGSRTLADEPRIVAAAIRETLGLPLNWSRAFDTWENALRALIQKIEEIGVVVMVNGVVENNTHRPLDVEEFRGFAISDPYAPLIFINGTDAKAAQMFTLVHELAHLWLGQGGISDVRETADGGNAVEIFCNKVAAEFLIPANEMAHEWPRVKTDTKRFEKLARLFRISPIVAARRALEMEFISTPAYFEFYRNYLKESAQRKAKQKNGGDFYVTLGTRLGKRFPTAVYSAAREGRLPYREAYQLTGLSGAKYDNFAHQLGLTP